MFGGISHGRYFPVGICPGVFVQGVYILDPIKYNVSNNNANELTIIYVFIYFYIHKNMIS